MNAVFADTSFFLAFLNEDDNDQHAAHNYMASHAGEIDALTSDHHFEQAGFRALLRK